MALKTVSVPLRGFCFSTKPVKQAAKKAASKSFRPLTGILFFNVAYRWNSLKQVFRFRPLTGILFFNKHRKYSFIGKC